MNKHNLKVGQSIFIKFERHSMESLKDLREYKVEKIGRVWAKLNHAFYRLNLESLVVDGSRGTAYLSHQQYTDAVELRRTWSDFCIRVREVEHRRPTHMTTTLIKEARLKLGI